jgi:hypothetical protein
MPPEVFRVPPPVRIACAGLYFVRMQASPRSPNAVSGSSHLRTELNRFAATAIGTMTRYAQRHPP